MIISPSTNINILHNAPLDTTYTHTIYFASAGDQSGYFAGLTKHRLTSLTYQRVTPNKCRVGIKAESLYDCNYMMFQNSAFGTKWFYAFINSVEYVNNECSEITFEIDVIQTWLFDHSVGQTYIERCHPGSDMIGDNITPENIAVGEYVMNTYEHVSDLDDLFTVIAIADTSGGDESGDLGDGEDQDPDHGPGVEGTRAARAGGVSGKVYDGVYGGCTLYAYRTAGDINAKIAEYIASPDSIVDIYTIPAMAVYNNTGPVTGWAAAATTNVTVTKPTALTRLNGYIPHNCKLYTYPYCFLHVDNASGDSLDLRYEFFDSGVTPQLGISTKVTQPVVTTLRPRNYKGSSIGGTGSGRRTNKNTGECLQLTNYPLCSWNMDSYKTWVAQNKWEIATTALKTIGTVGVNTVAGGVVQGYASAVGSVGQIEGLLSQAYKASIAADMCRGTVGGGNANCADGIQSFFYGMASVTAEFAQMIDGYFDMFGYRQGKIMPYFRNARPHWTYIKTVGVCPTGSVPADDMKKICQIYDRGITWWKNGSEVGRYDLDNRAQIRG